MPKSFKPTNIGFILNDLRVQKNEYQHVVANNVGCARETIDAIENMRTNPSLHNLINILDYFNCEIVIKYKDVSQDVYKLKLLKKD